MGQRGPNRVAVSRGRLGVDVTSRVRDLGQVAELVGHERDERVPRLDVVQSSLDSPARSQSLLRLSTSRRLRSIWLREGVSTGIGALHVADLRVWSGAEGNRTPGLLDATEALYQLSYSPKRCGC
jgi:hypothetical protein